MVIVMVQQSAEKMERSTVHQMEPLTGNKMVRWLVPQWEPQWEPRWDSMDRVRCK